MKVTLLVPTLNEYESMIKVMPLIDKSCCDQILVVDGGSKDGTVEWAQSQGYEVIIQKKKGLRQAYLEALDYIKGDVIITFSPDGNSLADRIPLLVTKMKEGYDMVIVSRYLPPASSQDDDLLTGFGNWFFTKLINVLHKAKYTDTFVMFRGYRKSLLLELDLLSDRGYRTPERLFKTKIPVEPLLSVRAARRKCKISEIPGDEPARIGGVRKLEMFRWGLGFLYQIIREVFPQRSYYASVVDGK
ncbi:MAG: glycosyltransferase family 2 protein [Deltaproteobacteria bacterium]|nr:glycosyltransferase family 2 protein [Deltaproteobacteria bacterium]